MVRLTASLAMTASLAVALLPWSGTVAAQGVIWGDPDVVERLMQKRQEAARQRALRNDQLAPAPDAIDAGTPVGDALGLSVPPAGGGDYVLMQGGCVEIEGRSACVGQYRIGVNEVSNAEYRRFVAGHDSGAYRQHGLNADRQPVARVSTQDALRYADWLSRQTGQRYRLPTRAEWRHAAEQGGYSSVNLCAQGNVADRTAMGQVNDAWRGVDCDDNYGVSAPVGSFRPDASGLRDMLGNVWEWVCTDERGRCADGAGPQALAKGGAWSNGVDSVGPNAVYARGAGSVSPIIGFRLVQEVR